MKSRPSRMLHFSSTPRERIAFISAHTRSRSRRNTGTPTVSMPPGSELRFEYRNLVTDAHQVVRDGQAGDSCAHHRYAFMTTRARLHEVVIGGLVQRGIARLGPIGFRDEALERANGDGLVQIATAAIGFAGSAADAPADGGERIPRPRQAVGVLVAALGNGGHVAAGIRMHDYASCIIGGTRQLHSK